MNTILFQDLFRHLDIYLTIGKLHNDTCHFTSTTRIRQFAVFLCKLEGLFFKPQQDWQIRLNIPLCFQAMCDKYRLPFVDKFHEEPLAQHYEVLVHV